METERKKYYLVNDFIILTIACFIFAMAWEGFMIPNGMSAGGMMGLCTVVQYATGGLIPAQYSYFAINVILIVVAVIAMGIGFGFKTIYCIVVSSLAMEVIASVPEIHSVMGQFFYVRETLLIPIIAGLLDFLARLDVCGHGAVRNGQVLDALVGHERLQGIHQFVALEQRMRAQREVHQREYLAAAQRIHPFLHLPEAARCVDASYERANGGTRHRCHLKVLVLQHFDGPDVGKAFGSTTGQHQSYLLLHHINT